MEPGHAKIPQYLDDVAQMSSVGVEQMGSSGHGGYICARSAAHVGQGIEQPGVTATADYYPPLS